MVRAPWGLLALLSLPLQAADWQFSDPAMVAAGAPGVFHHLEASGRRSLAVAAGTVALTWEDNRSGRPQVFVAFGDAEGAFAATAAQSGSADAYEPAIVSAADAGFLLGWEESEHVHMRVVTPRTSGPPLRIDAPSAQITFARGPEGRLFAAWVDKGGAFGRVVVAAVAIEDDDRVALGAAVPVDGEAPRDQQLYPAIAATDAGVTVAWEDRRHGHTRLLYRHAGHDLRFTTPIRELNERPPAMSARFGRGSGVTRVALAASGQTIAATWMDKREFRGGYDIYAAVSDDGGRSFGANEKVQDMFGENVPQWHPAVASAPGGRMAVVWDDSRDDAGDVWLSWRGEGDWSEDMALPGAHGPGVQSHPVVRFDAEGGLHVAWIERSPEGESSIRYARAVTASE